MSHDWRGSNYSEELQGMHIRRLGSRRSAEQKREHFFRGSGPSEPEAPVIVVHVKDGIPLTPTGEKLLEQLRHG